MVGMDKHTHIIQKQKKRNLSPAYSCFYVAQHLNNVGNGWTVVPVYVRAQNPGTR